MFWGAIFNLLSLYVAVSFISLFWQGIFLNSDLTDEQYNAPTKSYFTYFFFVFTMFNLIPMALLSTIFLLLQPCVVLLFVEMVGRLRNRRQRARARQERQEI